MYRVTTVLFAPIFSVKFFSLPSGVRFSRWQAIAAPAKLFSGGFDLTRRRLSVTQPLFTDHTTSEKRKTMRRTSLVLLCVVCLVVLGAVMITRGVSAQNATSSIYFPYPTGIIPSDLVSEIARVNREVSLIESEALTQWNSLRKNSGTAMRQVQLLGKIELFDKNLSVNKNQACSFCHMPYAGFSGPIPSVNLAPVAYPGSSHFRFGKRKPQSYTYSPFYPVLQFNKTQREFLWRELLGSTCNRIPAPKRRCRTGARSCEGFARNGLTRLRLHRPTTLPKCVSSCV
jgi:hypothetical protein